MAQQAPNVTSITGIVESINDNGFKLQGGNWLNYSQYGYKGPKGGMPAPQAGQTVTALVKNDKFINALTMNGVAPQAPTTTPTPISPMAATPQPTQAQPSSDLLLRTTIDTRLKLIGTLAVAQPALFSLEDMDTVTEIVRNLEQFVLEDLLAATRPEPDDELSADDVLDESV
jgi:hypothetical protein